MGIPREYNPFGLHVHVTVMESGSDIFIYCLSAKSKLHKQKCPVEAKGKDVKVETRFAMFTAWIYESEMNCK